MTEPIRREIPEIELDIPGINAMSNWYRSELIITEIGYKTFIFHFSKIEDPRDPRGKRHELIHIFILTIIGILRGFNDFENMADDLKYDEKELTEKLGLKHGIPSHDTFSKVFRLIDPKAFMHAFIDWTYSYITLVNDHIAIDGKGIRAATEKIEGKNTPYILNSYVCGQELVLGQMKVNEKTNEITGIPDLLKCLDIKGCTITIDAIGCQKRICELIHGKGAHFVLPAKENQRLLHEAIAIFAEDAYANWLKEEEQIEKQKAKGHKGKGEKLYLPYHDMMDVYHEVDPKAEHGREPGDRLYIVIYDTSMINKEAWPYVNAVGYTIRKRTVIKRYNGKDVSETSTEKNTWILSNKKTTAREFGKIARGHWGIENKLHGVIDSSFREDWNTTRKDNAMENLALMRKICYNFMTLDPAVKGMTKKKAFNYYRRHTDEIIKLIFLEIPKAQEA